MSDVKDFMEILVKAKTSLIIGEKLKLSKVIDAFEKFEQGSSGVSSYIPSQEGS